MIYPIDWQWLNDWSHVLLMAMVVREFMNNLLARTPSLKSNTIFECVYNTLDSAIVTVKGKPSPKTNAPE